MRYALMAVMVLATALVTLSFSQAGQAGMMRSPAGDSSKPMMNAPAQAAPCCMNGQMAGMPGPQCAPGYCMPGGRGMPGMFAPMCRPYRRLMLLPFFFLGIMFLAMAVVNILLTVLVCMDMSQLGRFNGLWIPILLLFGIPGTALYALFRIGDTIKAAAK